MSAMTTVLTEFADNGNSRTYTLAGHTIQTPKLVIQKRRVPENGQTQATIDVEVIIGTEDADGMALQQKVGFLISVRQPILGQSADVAAALAIFRDIVAGDEFANSVSTQEWLV